MEWITKGLITTSIPMTLFDLPMLFCIQSTLHHCQKNWCSLLFFFFINIYAQFSSKFLILSKYLLFVESLKCNLNLSVAFFESNHFLLKPLRFLQLLKYHQLLITMTLFKFQKAKTDFKTFKIFKQFQKHNATISSPTSNMICGNPENCT